LSLYAFSSSQTWFFFQLLIMHRKTKSEKTKRRTRTTSYSNDCSVEDIC
jgi:hypothetical protein